MTFCTIGRATENNSIKYELPGLHLEPYIDLYFSFTKERVLDFDVLDKRQRPKTVQANSENIFPPLNDVGEHWSYARGRSGVRFGAKKLTIRDRLKAIIGAREQPEADETDETEEDEEEEKKEEEEVDNTICKYNQMD